MAASRNIQSEITGYLLHVAIMSGGTHGATKQELATKFGVSGGTVANAIRDVRERGIQIVYLPKLGGYVYVTNNKAVLAEVLRAEESKRADLATRIGHFEAARRQINTQFGLSTPPLAIDAPKDEG